MTRKEYQAENRANKKAARKDRFISILDFLTALLNFISSVLQLLNN